MDRSRAWRRHQRARQITRRLRDTRERLAWDISESDLLSDQERAAWIGRFADMSLEQRCSCYRCNPQHRFNKQARAEDKTMDDDLRAILEEIGPNPCADLLDNYVAGVPVDENGIMVDDDGFEWTP
jgi:hypothetical protein